MEWISVGAPDLVPNSLEDCTSKRAVPSLVRDTALHVGPQNRESGLRRLLRGQPPPAHLLALTVRTGAVTSEESHA